MPLLTNNKAYSEKQLKRLAKHLPNNHYINLAQVGVKKTNPVAAILGIAVILAGAAALGKYGVYDRLSEVYEAQNEVNGLQAQADALYAKVGELGDVSANYAHYTYSGMSDYEVTLADRIEALELIERVIVPDLEVGAWTLSGNTISLHVTGDTLETINQVVANLDKEEMVNYCNVITAATQANAAYVDPNTVSDDDEVDFSVTDGTYYQQVEGQSSDSGVIDSAADALANSLGDTVGIDTSPNGVESDSEAASSDEVLSNIAVNVSGQITIYLANGDFTHLSDNQEGGDEE